MKTKKITIHWDLLEREGIRLSPSEAIVYFTLDFLCKPKGFWEGTYTELAEECRIGSRKSAQRITDKLSALGLVNGQNDRTNGQNDRNPKDKEKKQKKKKIEIKKISERDKESVPPLPQNFSEKEKDKKDIEQPKIDEKQLLNFYLVIVGEYGFLQPNIIYKPFYNHFEGHGWPKSGSPLHLLRNWLDNEMHRPNGLRPILNEDERKYLANLCLKIPAKGARRLLDILIDFHLGPTCAKFDLHCTPQQMKDFDEWLCKNLDTSFSKLYPNVGIAYSIA